MDGKKIVELLDRFSHPAVATVAVSFLLDMLLFIV